MSDLENMVYIFEIGVCIIGALYFANQTTEAVHAWRDKKRQSKTTTRK